MSKQISPKIIALTFGVLVISFLAAFYVVAWQEPGSAPPGGNVPAPLNIGPIGQSKEGGLILNTGGAANGLIIDKGNVGIGITVPGYKLDVSGDINASGIYRKGGSAGITQGCTPAQVLKGATVSGGIITAGNCGSPGGTLVCSTIQTPEGSPQSCNDLCASVGKVCTSAMAYGSPGGDAGYVLCETPDPGDPYFISCRCCGIQ